MSRTTGLDGKPLNNIEMKLIKNIISAFVHSNSYRIMLALKHLSAFRHEVL